MRFKVRIIAVAVVHQHPVKVFFHHPAQCDRDAALCFGQRAIGVDSQLANQMIDDERGVTDQLSIDLDVGNFPFWCLRKVGVGRLIRDARDA